MKKIVKNLLIILMSFSANAIHATDLTNTKNFSLFGELIYWNASEQTDSVWANDIGFPATNHVTYSTPNVKFDWSTGFRGGIAYEFPRLWNVKFAWTHLPTSTNMNYVAAPNHLLTPEFFSGYLSGNTFSSANINWQIAMNVVDLTLSHAFKPTPSFILAPSIGIKEAMINQTLNSNWNATLFSVPIFTSTEVVKNNFAGIGPSFGIDGAWNFYKSFSIVGNFSTAFMWGHWNINDTYSRPSALSGLIQPKTITTQMTDAKLGTSMFQYFVGLQWTYESTYQTKFLLGYEMQYWANQLRVPTFQLLPLHGDLTYQGGTCGISISL